MDLYTFLVPSKKNIPLIRRPPKEITAARSWLETTLARGPLQFSEIMRLKDDKKVGRFGINTLRKAKSTLGVESRKLGVEWFWGLPDSDWSSSIASARHTANLPVSGARSEGYVASLPRAPFPRSGVLAAP